MARRRSFQKQQQKKDIVWDPGEANAKQKLFYLSRTTYTAYGGAKGGGKALTLDTPICTPFGWRRMGDIQVGDTVIGRDGGHTKVIGVFPQGVLPIYRMTFIDGASVECSGDHLWTAKRTARKGGWKVYTTEQLRDLLCSKDSNLLIPLCGPVRFTRGKRGGKIRPYTLGVLLGDGSLTEPSVSVTSDDEELFQHIEEEGYELTQYSSRRNLRYGFRNFRKEYDWLVRKGLNCRSESKYIPDGYKYGSVEERYAILQGLMDTDGTADDRGHCEFCSVSRQLAEDVQFLVRSLGGKATLRAKQTYCYTEGYEGPGQTAYVVYIQTPDNEKLFRLERKKARCRGRSFNGGISELCRRIVSIEPCGTAECQCIAVDNPDSLYVTKDFIVTHNTHAVRIKAVGGALANAGIRILIMRRTYPELEENHIRPIVKMVPPALASYNATTHLMTFHNGSTIKFGHWSGDASEDEYNGLEYDWIFIDEATQFSERSFNFLGGCLRGVNEFPKRMYLTCNPGGVGHRWVKRLFIDRNFKQGCDNPEENENPEDYTFIPATVEDNYHLMQSSPGYVRMLANMPEDKRRAYRYGDWNAIGGNFFPEFSSRTHVVKPFKIPDHWQRYRSFDYGLDMFACFWWAVDEDGRSWCYREFCHKGLIVKEAAEKIHELTLPGENISATYAPPDMWSRQKDTGKTMAEIFMINQVGLIRADNNRVQGHMMMKEAMAPRPLRDPYVQTMFRQEDGTVPDRLPGLMFFDVCKDVVNDIQDIQADEKNPNDCAKDPHEVTHTVDGVRYYCVSRVLPAESQEAQKKVLYEDDDEDGLESYEEFMCGGEASPSYLAV